MRDESRAEMSIQTPDRAWARQRRALVYGAMFIDMLGGGLFGPFELLYGYVVVGLTLPTAGLLIAIGAAASIAVGPLAGSMVDRVGAGRIVSGSNVLGVIGCLVLLTASPLAFVVGIFLLSATQRAFYGAFTPFVAVIAESRELELWFGRIRAFRYVGLSLGAALSGAALVIGQGTGLRVLVMLDAVSYVVATALLWRAARGVMSPHEAAPQATGGYRAALADRANLALAALNVWATLLITAPFVAMPVFVLEVLHQPAWLPGFLAAANTATLVAGSTVSARLLRGRRRLTNLAAVSGVWAFALALFLVSAMAPRLVPIGLFAGMILLGFGEALYAPLADTLPLALAPPPLRGRYAALHQMAWGVSETAAPALAGFLLAMSGSMLWGVLAGLAVATTVAYETVAARINGRDGIAGEPLSA
jgi:MFS family permease